MMATSTLQPSPDDLRSFRYDPRTVALHWLTAGLVVLMWLGAHAIDWFPRGPLRVDARSLHIVTGVFLAALVCFRVFWRVRGGAKPGDAPTLPNRVAWLVHALLYLVVATTLVLGIANAWVRGDSLFGLITIPPFGDFDKAARHELANAIVGWHQLAANAVLVLAGGHALAALFHHYGQRDNRLRRMVPYLRQR